MIGLLEKSPFAYAYHEIVTDTAGHPVDYRFLEVNAAFEKMTGFPADAVAGKLVSELIPGIRTDEFDWVSTYGKVALEGGSVQFEQYSAQLDRWYSVQAYSDTPRFFAAFFFDVTEKHRASSELEGFFSVNLDLLCIADTDGKFIKLNREWEKVLGYREDELAGRSFLDFVHPDDMDNTLAAISELGEQRPVLNFINRYRARNGDYRSLEWRSQPRGKRIYAAARDVTEKVLYEERLVVAKEAADEASRAKSDFLANMSHEIRTPMNAIMGLSKLALGEGLSANDGPPPQHRDAMRKIYDAARLLLGIINDVLDYSKIEAGRLDLDVHSFALSDILDQIRDLFSVAVREKGLAFLVEIDPSVPVLCKGDSLRIAQVLTNLVGNSVKFTERGSVSLSARPGKSGANRVLFSVRDTGIGIDAEKAGTLFRAFSQGDASTTRKYGGTGLGLVISSRLVAAMGGTLSFSSESGKGSDFFFEIDLPPAERETLPEDASGNHAPRNGAAIPFLTGKVVLLAEDNELNIEVGRRFVEKTGARVTIARDGSEAVAIALRGDIDLVLMDIQMPVMDGYEATRRIKEALPDLPIIALTAGVMEGDRSRAKNAGMDGHVAKPIDENNLFAVLSFWLASGDGQSRSAPGSENGEGRALPVGRLVPESLIGFEARDGDHTTERDEVFRVQILGMFRDQLRETFSGTANAVRSGNETLAREQVHSLKGIAGIVGASRIAQVASALNTLYADGGERGDLARLADELESSVGEALASLEFLDGLPAGLVEYHDDDTRASGRGASRAISAGDKRACAIPRRARVLIVDDQPINVRSLTDALGGEYDVLVARDGESALEISRGERPPHVILLDINMPGTDGYEVCRRLKDDETTRDIAVVFITARDDANDEERGFLLGGADYIKKPFNPIVVGARVRNQVSLIARSALLEEIAHTDALTGVPNRRSFEEGYSRLWRHCARERVPISALMVDIDHFKPYNDGHGHGAGDDCLRRVALALQGQIGRPLEIFARYGGEEFAGVLSATDARGARFVSEQMLQAVRDLSIPHGFSSCSDVVTVSIGYATLIPDDRIVASELIRRADHALYAAKRDGRDRVVAYFDAG